MREKGTGDSGNEAKTPAPSPTRAITARVSSLSGSYVPSLLLTSHRSPSPIKSSLPVRKIEFLCSKSKIKPPQIESPTIKSSSCEVAGAVGSCRLRGAADCPASSLRYLGRTCTSLHTARIRHRDSGAGATARRPDAVISPPSSPVLRCAIGRPPTRKQGNEDGPGGCGELRRWGGHGDGSGVLRSLLRRQARARCPPHRGHWFPGRPPALREIYHGAPSI